MGMTRASRYKSPRRCNETAGKNGLCPYHERFSVSVVGDRFQPHRELVGRIPLPGYEAMLELAREIGL
jgi:hypothetical protein